MAGIGLFGLNATIIVLTIIFKPRPLDRESALRALRGCSQIFLRDARYMLIIYMCLYVVYRAISILKAQSITSALIERKQRF